MALYSAIRDEIIVEIGGDVNDNILSTNIFSFIKSALRRFPRHTRSRFLFTTKTASLTTGNYSVSLPSGFIRERSVYYIDSGARIYIEKLSFDDFNEQFNSTATGSPQSGYRIIGSTMEFLRSADTNYTIYIECLKEIDSVETTDTFSGDSSVIEILKDGAKYYYYDYEEDDKRAGDKLALFKAGLDKLESDFLSDEIPSHIGEA